ncbi:MAG: trigger factor [Alphaproteobacteria bacterium]|nr:trigger factor [Alphaproteobacteria bacterium]NCQ88123.1 trigger factor [Alphaproteobacteria bacterium]NCT05370.1 trigger factor [Alphaproteobacteria bacterium]
MQVKEIKSEGLKHELEVIVPANDIQKHVEAKLLEVGKTVKMQGFRPGKVPMDILKKRYGKAVLGEVLETAVNDATSQVIKDKKLRPAMQPKIEVQEFDEGKDLKYTMELEVLPDFKVMDIKGMKLEKLVAKLDKKEIDDALKRITAQHKGSKKISGDRATKSGDIVIMDFHGRTKDDGVEHEGMHAHGTKLELGSGQFIPGFEDQLIGKKAGEKVEVNVTFPEQYGAAKLAGRDAIFDVEIKEIHEATDAVVNDDFAKELGFDDEKALRDAVENQLSKDYEAYTRMKLKRQILDILDDNHQFDLPESMQKAEYEGIMQQIEAERAADPEQKDKQLTDDEKEELEAIAERRVRLGLVIADIGQANGVTVANNELQGAVISEAQKYPGQERMVFEYYQKNPQALEGLRAPLFEEKVVDLIVEGATVTEKSVSIEELTKEDDEEFKPKKKAVKKTPAKKAPAKKAAKKDDK